MLSKWQKSIENYVPIPMVGYDYVKRITVFIPIREISITVQERRVLKLSSVQICILALINLGIQSPDELAEYIGVSEDIMIQMISQLDTERMVAISAGTAILTDAGKKALTSENKEQRIQRQFGKIYINPITGEISDIRPKEYCLKPSFGNPYLEEEIVLSVGLLRKQFDALKKLYNEQKVERAIFGSEAIESAELYRITDISSQRLIYIKDSCFVYLNREDQSLAFQFGSGKTEYAEALAEQLRARMNGAMKILSQPVRATVSIMKRNEKSEPDALIETLKNSKGNNRYTEIEKAYYQDRMLLDGELIDFIEHNEDFRPEKILIEAPILNEILPSQISSIPIGSKVQEITIIYNEKDQSAERIISELRSKLRQNRQLKLVTVKKENIDAVKIWFGEQCAINGYYLAYETIYKRSIFKLCAYVSFDKMKNQKLWVENTV